MLRVALRILITGIACVAIAASQQHSKERGVQVVTSPLASQARGKTYALLIGISRYLHDPPVNSLRFADSDAETLAELLSKPLGGGLKRPEQITLLTNEKATRANIDDAVRELSRLGAGPDDELIVFIAGHGVYLRSEEDPVTHRPIDLEPYILTYESNTQDPKTTGYPMDEFRQMIAKQAARVGRVFVFVDVCRAGNIAGIAGGSDLEEAVQRVFENRAGGLGLLLAAHARKFAYEAEAFGGGHGAFSYFLIAGMNGLAALPGSGSISFGDLAVYVTENVYRYTRGKQLPVHAATDDTLPVIYDVAKEGIQLKPARPLETNELRDVTKRSVTQASASAPQQLDRGDDFAQALARGSLLPQEPDNAWDILSDLRNNAAISAAELRLRERALKVALEDRGQMTVSKYLEGEQAGLQKKHFEDCARSFDQALLLDPNADFDRARSLFCKGRALIFDARYDEAIRILQDSIQIDSKRAYAFNALGIAYLEDVVRNNGGFADAQAAFLNAMRFAPYWAYPVHNLALTYTQLGDYQSAIRTYRQAMQLAPNYAYLPYNLGLLYQRLNRLSEAEGAYQKAIALQPDLADAFNALGYLRETQGHAAAAEVSYRRALEINPVLQAARQNLAVLIFRQRGRAQEAIDLWRLNLAAQPDYLPSRLSVAMALADTDIVAAIAEYTDALRVRPDYLEARLALADLFERRKDYDQAGEQLAKALEVQPGNPLLLERLGDLEARQGHAERASSYYRRVLDDAIDRDMRTRIGKKIAKLVKQS